MKSRIRTRKKRTREETPDLSSVPFPGMFQERSFPVQGKLGWKSQQPDMKTSLMRADKYGHHLDRMQPAVLPGTVVQGKGIGKKIGEKFVKNDRINDRINESSFVGSISSAVSELSQTVNVAAAGGMGGILGIPGVVKDGYETFKGKGKEKLNPAAKFLAGGVESGANIAKFAGEAVSSLGVGISGGVGGAVAGAINTIEGGKNVFKARKDHNKVKGIAGNAAAEIGGENVVKTTKNMKQMKAKRPELEREMGRLKEKIYYLEAQETTKREKINTKTSEISKPKPGSNVEALSAEKQKLEAGLEEITKKLTNYRSELTEKENKLKEYDILDVSLGVKKILKKTKNREMLHTAAGVGQTLGGALSAAGAGVAGIGAIPGASIGLASASIKPLALGVRKGKQFLRKHNLGNNNKSDENKKQQRYDLANKLLAGREQEDYKKMFATLPGATNEDIKDFNEGRLKIDRIKEILKERQYLTKT